MKWCHRSLSLFRQLYFQYRCPTIGRHDKILAYHVQSRGEVASTPDGVLGENFIGSRQSSSASAGIRIPTNFDDFHSIGVDNVSQNINDQQQVGHSITRSRSEEYGQTVGEFLHHSIRTSHLSVNGWTSPQSHGHRSTDNTGPDHHHNAHSNNRNAAANQQTISQNWNCSDPLQQSRDDLNVGNKQENTGIQLSSNGYRQGNTVAHLGNTSGYYNSNPGATKQILNGTHDTQSLSSDKPSGYSGDDVEGTLEELDALCSEWDLKKAVECMTKLGNMGVCVDLPRYLVLIEACGNAKALIEAKAVHEHIVRFMSPIKINTFNKILEMYGKCGSMEDAYSVFNQMPERNLTSWDIMITWFAKNGLGEDAIDMFTQFKEVGLKPDGEMFFGVFDACGVLGDITEGMLHFESMSKIYGITPSVAHYCRIVHMFGSAGDLEGALEFIEKMPIDPNADVWETLMNISRVQGNLDLGDRCAKIVEQLDPSRMSGESKAGLLPIKDSEPPKKVNKTNPLASGHYEYRAGDRSHPENDKIYTILRGIRESLNEAGYIPEIRLVLHDIDPEAKEEAIMAHSERLACTYALITSPARTPIRILKNLRVCVDCHNAFKIISKLVGRFIVMRDAKRFHHFSDGKCTCNDFW